MYATNRRQRSSSARSSATNRSVFSDVTIDLEENAPPEKKKRFFFGRKSKQQRDSSFIEGGASPPKSGKKKSSIFGRFITRGNNNSQKKRRRSSGNNRGSTASRNVARRNSELQAGELLKRKGDNAMKQRNGGGAIEYYKKYYNIVAEIHGTDNEIAGSALEKLADAGAMNVANGKGDPLVVDEQYQEVYRIYKRHFGEDDLRVIDVYESRYVFMNGEGLSGSYECLDRLVEMKERNLVKFKLSEVALNYIDLGKKHFDFFLYSKAADCFDRALDLLRLGSDGAEQQDDFTLGLCLLSLGLTLEKLGEKAKEGGDEAVAGRRFGSAAENFIDAISLFEKTGHIDKANSSREHLEAVVSKGGNPSGKKRDINGVQDADGQHIKEGEVKESQGQYLGAILSYENAHRACIEKFGRHDIRSARVLHKLASVTAKRGEHEWSDADFGRALALYDEVYNTYRAKLGDDHHDTKALFDEKQGATTKRDRTRQKYGEIKSKEERANELMNQHKYEDAMDCYEEILEQKKRMNGEDLNYAKTLATMGNIESVLLNQEIPSGTYDQAIQYLERAISIFLEKLPEDDEHLITAIASTGDLYFGRDTSGDDSKALECYERAIAAKKRRGNTKNSLVGNMYCNSGEIHFKQEQYEQAISNFKSALECRKGDTSAESGVIHQCIGLSFEKIGDDQNIDGNYNEAAATYSIGATNLTMARNIFEADLGPNHHNTQMVTKLLKSLTAKIQSAKRMSNGDDAYAAVPIHDMSNPRRLTGMEVSSVSSNDMHMPGQSKKKLSRPFRVGKMGETEIERKEYEANESMRKKQYDDAMARYETVLGMKKANFGETDIRVAYTYERMANVEAILIKMYPPQGTYDQAISLYEKAISVYKLHLPSEHVSILFATACMGDMYFGRGRPGDDITALGYYNSSLQLIMDKQIKMNPDLVGMYSNMGELYYARSDFQMALRCFLAAVSGLSEQDEEYADEEYAILLQSAGLSYVKSADNSPNTSNVTRNYESALRSFMTAHEILAAKFGDDHKLTIDVLHHRGDVNFKLGNYEEALTCYMKELNVSKKFIAHFTNSSLTSDDSMSLADRHSRVILLLRLIGITHMKRGQLTKAMAFMEEALEIIRDQPQAHSNEELMAALIAVAPVYCQLGDPKHAISCYKEALDMKPPGQEYPIAQYNLARLYASINRSDMAQPLFEALLPLLMSNLERYHREAYNVLRCIGDHHFTMGVGGHGKALGCYRVALIIREKYESRNIMYPYVTAITSTVGFILYSAGDFEQAIHFNQAALDNYRNKRGPTNSDRYAALQNNVANSMMKVGEYNRALDCYSEAVQVKKACFGEQDIRVLGAIVNLGVIQQELQNYAESVACFEEARSILSGALSSKLSFEVANACLLLGNIYLKRDDFTAASTCFGIVRDRSDARTEEAHRARACLGYISSKQGKFDHALKMYKSAISSDENSENMVALLNGIGNIYAMERSHNEALFYYEKAMNVSRTINVNKKTLAKTLQNIGNIYRKKRDFDSAEACFEEALGIRKAIGEASTPVDNAKLMIDW
eukprot:CAMPEP_0196821692 /NCGR_PEP_ID=MMETSP1362-20130617/80436_1 /TAXON_ID=163516 /ORGANISM="Leptocylindrus danicus, Strain CCMP1856" /LENGTH=1548 /DNA_ID=CAMNT_0042200991 /DNA_START=201 /DNA_END=4844 /DNA_ORIENTATION=+